MTDGSGIDRREWERDAVVWLAGRRIEADLVVPSDPRLGRAAACFLAWNSAARDEADAARFAALVRRRVAALGRSVRRIDHAPEPVRLALSGPLARMIEAAREVQAAPLAELGVAAGTGRELLDEPCDAWVALPADLPAGRYVALRVVGDSMVPLLHSGDVVLVDLEGAVHTGAVAVARHPEHGYVVKRVGRTGRQAVSLVSLNPAYPSLELLPGRSEGGLIGPVVLRWCAHPASKPGLAPRP
jgi:SOS-response transcriptional repressor LexA